MNDSPDRYESKVALVTGASAGIGAAIARKLVKLGMIVIGAARRIEKLQELEKELASEKGCLVPYQCDLVETKNIYDMFTYIKENYGGVDVCVNNAGSISSASLLDGNPEDWMYLMNLNLISHCLCSQLTVKSLQERNINEGHIFIINSQAGQQVFEPGFTHFYSATKFALNAATEGLRIELHAKRLGIKVTEISPGLVLTDLIKKFPIDAIDTDDIEIPALLPDDIAKTLCQILLKPRRVEITKIILSPS